MSEPAMEALAFGSTGRSHAGRVRELNEDRLLDRPDLALWAVADGMGGHQAGEVASTMIVEALGEVAGQTSGYGYLNAVCARLQEVNARLVRRAATLPGGGVIGATVVALLVFEGHFACVWAGDSRAYRWRDGRLSQLTRDHSLVQAMVDAGDLAPQAARAHHSAHVVTRAVGAGETLRLDVEHGAAQAGDLFLLCSDGLSGAIEDAELETVLAARAGLDETADRLLDLALGRGARDNVTFVLVRAGRGGATASR